jgi:hypothetical protein
MNKYLTNTTVAMVLAYTLVLPTSFAQVPAVSGTNTGGVDTSTTITTSAPITSGTDTGGASTNTSGSSAPATTGTDTGGASTNTSGSSVPTTSGTNTGGASTNTSTATPPPVTGTNTGGATTATPTTPVTPPSGGGGGSTTYGGSSSSGGSIVPIYVVSTSTPTTTPFTSCPLITSYMKSGANNNSAEVIKLQAFLKTSENQNVDLNGIFDSKTETAVKNFQRKYLTDIMGPWDATAPSGIVYITTKKKINELACNTPLTLNANELSIINSYVQNLNSSTTSSVNGGTNSSIGPNAPTSTPIIGENNNGTANTASVVNASVFQRIWDWIVHLFKR